MRWKKCKYCNADYPDSPTVIHECPEMVEAQKLKLKLERYTITGTGPEMDGDYFRAKDVGKIADEMEGLCVLNKFKNRFEISHLTMVRWINLLRGEEDA